MRVSCVCVSCMSHVHLMYVSYSMYGVRYVSVTSNKCSIIHTSWAKLIFRCCLSLHGSKVKVNPMKRTHPSYPTDTACLEVDISRLKPDIFVSGSSCEGTNLDSLPQWLGLWVFLKPIKSLQLQTVGATAPGAIPDLLTYQVGNQLKQLLRKQNAEA